MKTICKKIQLLMAALLMVSFSMTVVSCSSDDDNNGTEGGTGGGDGEFELPEGVLSLEDEYLRTIICAFTDEQPLELTQDPNWKKKAYQVTLGTILDESHPTIRLVEAGNVLNADQMVLDLLGSLGMNSDNPDGFSYENQGVRVKYERNTVGDPNTLAIIEIDMPRILPDLTELRLVKTKPFNDGEQPFYHLGDIVKQNDQLYVCVSNHDYEEAAIFLSFHQAHKKFPWPWKAHKANMTFYNANDPMANNRALYNWVTNILLDDTNYNLVVSRLNATGNMNNANQVLPQSADERLRLAQSLFDSSSQTVEIGTNAQDFMDLFKWQEDSKSGGSVVAPKERILCNNYRFAPAGGTTEFWVPYLLCVKDAESDAVDKQLRAIKSQKTKEFTTDRSVSFTNKFAALSGITNYRIHTAAMHWALGNYASGKWAVYDFTQDWSQKNSGDSKWLNSCVTSNAISFTDNGEARSGLTAVSLKVN